MTSRPHGHGRPGRILLVEDDDDDARLIREAIREVNPTRDVSRVADGEQALAFLRRQAPFDDAPKPDLVLLDLNLPRRDGRNVLVDIKSDPRLRRTPVLALTSSAAESDIRAAYDAHANAYLRKPVSFSELAEAIRTIEAFWFGAVLTPAA
jgi:two-component system, chemotaxis family, response regulator Rcp1